MASAIYGFILTLSWWGVTYCYNDQWRICFVWTDKNVEMVDYHYSHQACKITYLLFDFLGVLGVLLLIVKLGILLAVRE